MKNYARIYDGAVAELFSTDGNIAELFHPELIWVDITNDPSLPIVGWRYDGVFFSPPPAPTPEQIRVQNTATRDALIRSATTIVDTLQDAVDSGVATEEETSMLQLWKQHRLALYRCNLDGEPVEWPLVPVV